ncbi:MAG: BTAD domain-containing putative transcriptional regulator [Caldilineaceae bacterium]
MSTLTFRLLGAPQIVSGHDPVSGFVTSKAQALLIYLASTRALHTRDALAGLFWPDMPEANAKNNLRRTLPNLRQLVGPHLLIDNRTITFNREADYWLDVEEFTGLSADLSSHAALDSIPLEQLAAKTVLYRGEFLHGFHVPNLPEFEHWVLMQREHLREQAIRSLTVLANRYVQAGDIDAGLTTTRRLLSLEPWCEIAHYQQMLLLAYSGQRGQALAQYETCRTLLHNEFGAEPSAEMTAQYQRIKSGAHPVSESTFPQHRISNLYRPAHRSTPSAVEIRSAITPSVDWGDIPRPSAFYNRQREVAELLHWLVDDPHSVVGLMGTGGMGKTLLAAHTVRILANPDREGAASPRAATFEHIIWRSLINAPSLITIVQSWVQILVDEPSTQWPIGVNELLDLLFERLQAKRCLLILDNLESILQEDTHAGHFRPGYEDYEILLRRMGETSHGSCLFFTSRELPMVVSQLERSHPTVCASFLSGLDSKSGVQLLTAEGLRAPAEHLSILVQRYSGNPMALKLVADSIHELYGGDVDSFLKERAIIFDDIRTVLEQQFNRLLPLEKEILCWLAIEREPVSLPKLANNWIQSPTQRNFVEAIRSLQRRGLIERAAEDAFDLPASPAPIIPCFTLQNVVMEFVSDQLIDRVFYELVHTPVFGDGTEKPIVAQYKLNRYSLVKAQSKAYIRDIQLRLLLQPLLRRLVDHWGAAYTVKYLQQWIAYLRTEQANLNGYVGANILHLLLQMDVDLGSCDFSHIHIRQVDLSSKPMLNVNFRGAHFVDSVFSNLMGAIEIVTLSPDGRFLASAGSDGAIYLWQASNYQLHHVLHGHLGMVKSICFSADSQWLFSGGLDGALLVWEVLTGHLVRQVMNQGKPIIAASLHRDGVYLAAALTDETIQIWDWQRVELRATLPALVTLTNLSFSPDGKYLISVGDERRINVWCGHHFDLLHTLEGHDGKILTIAFNAQSNLFATGGEDGKILLWDAAAMRLQQVLAGHTDFILALAFNPRADLLASSSADQTVHTWHLQTGRPHQFFRGHFGWVKAVTFSADARALITGGYDQTIRIWDIHNGQLQIALKGYLKRVDFMRFSADGRRLAASSLDGNVHVWDVQHARIQHSLRGSQAATRSMVFSQNGEWLATASDDHNVRLWDMRTGRLKRTMCRHTGFVRSMVFSRDERFLISGSHDRTLCVWETATGTLQWMATNVNATIQSAIACNPIAPHLAYASTDNTVNVITIPDGQSVRQFDLAATKATVMAFDSRGQLLACGTQDGQILIYDLTQADAHGEPLYRVQLTNSPIWRLLFSPDDKWLAWICAGQEIRLLDLANGQVSPAMPTYYGAFCLGFGNDSSQIFTDGANNALLVRDVTNGHIRHKLHGHTAALTSIEVSPAGDMVASSSADGSIRLWQPDTGVCLAVLQFHGPYAGMDITGATGITATQRRLLIELGAHDADAEDHVPSSTSSTSTALWLPEPAATSS